MIICNARNWKINKGFSLIEVVMSIIILSFIGIGIFQMYKVVSDQRDNLDDRVTANYFSRYIVTALRKNDISATLNKIGNPFYVYEKENEEIDFSNDPDYANISAGFQTTVSPIVKTFTQEITFLWGVVLKGVSYNNYKIATSYNGNKNTIYITK